jgi:hypothetical protein
MFDPDREFIYHRAHEPSLAVVNEQSITPMGGIFPSASVGGRPGNPVKGSCLCYPGLRSSATGFPNRPDPCGTTPRHAEPNHTGVMSILLHQQVISMGTSQRAGST